MTYKNANQTSKLANFRNPETFKEEINFPMDTIQQLLINPKMTIHKYICKAFSTYIIQYYIVHTFSLVL